MAQTDDMIVLYDGLRNTDESERPYSSRTLMVRYALCIKGIQHETFWVDWPDIATEATRVGAPPTGERDGKPRYTVPFIYDPTTRRAISDSQTIIAYLETQYPDTPCLFPPHTRALQAAFVQPEGADSVERRLLDAARPLFLARVLGTMTPRGREFLVDAYKRVTGAKAGLPAAEEERKEKIAEVLRVLDEVDGWLRGGEADGPGVFFTGEAPCNADVALAATLTSLKNASGKDSDVWQAILTANGGRWARYMDAFEPWYHVV
ncbi:hypothetical protein K488DRAFT_73122 [Vararia minispora EC-137]|uniref:Uncharacterized protein n=1 Tax=Vararia minispora EC-137 TaxID=1314806 RepID=A0ACB8QBS1_9AGAM|nr:hypothetical protein K488DRAFT_73122 [Vararia minispora EC-137]